MSSNLRAFYYFNLYLVSQQNVVAHIVDEKSAVTVTDKKEFSDNAVVCAKQPRSVGEQNIDYN